MLRFARPGEELLALDGRTYRLDDGMTVIADASGPVSLGGIMGGEGTGVDAETDRRAARGGAVRSAAHGGHRPQARHRERCPHPLRARARPGAGPAGDRVRDAADPRAVRRRGRRGRSSPARCRPTAPPSASGAPRLARLAGIELEPPEIERILARARASRSQGGPEEWQVGAALLAPRRQHRSLHRRGAGAAARLRPDPAGAADPRPRPSSSGVLTAAQRRRAAVRRAVAELGYAEAVTWSFIPPEQASMFGPARADPQAQPAQRRALGDAAVAAAEPRRGRGRATSRASRTTARCSSSGRASPAPCRASRWWRWPACATAGALPPHWAQPHAPGRRAGRQGRCAGGAGGAGHQAREPAGRGRRPRPGTIPAAPAACARAGPCWPCSASCIRGLVKALDLAAPLVAFELDLDTVPMPKARAEQGAADAGAAAVPAGRPRFRLRRRCGGAARASCWTRSRVSSDA